MISLVVKHFEAHANRKAIPFIFLLSLELLIISFSINAVLSSILQNSINRSAIDETQLPIRYEFLAVFVAPIFETFFLQQLPIYFAKKMKMKYIGQMIISSAFFASVHFSHGISHGVSEGLVGGVFLAFAYLTFEKKSRLKAFCVTATIHSLVNLVIVNVSNQ